MRKKITSKNIHILFTFGLILFCIGAIILSLKYLYDVDPNLSTISSLIKGEQDIHSSDDISAEWWNDNYNYYKQIEISNENSSETLKKGTLVSIIFDHKQLVKDGKSLADGSDLRVVFQNNDSYSTLEVSIAAPNTKKTQLQFALLQDIDSGTTENNYFLYYDNKSVGKNVLGAINEPEGENPADISELYQVAIGNEKHPPLFAKINRSWILKGVSEYKNLDYTVEVDDAMLFDGDMKYHVLKTSLSGTLKKLKNGIFNARIPATRLSPGTYQVQAEVVSQGKNITSPKQTFFVSYPLYVVLSVDWEGYDVDDNELEKIEQFSKEHHNLAYTQFFNPRIYITSEVSSQRATLLTEWIKNRNNVGDEIGLHLHMHFDMIKAAGVKVKKKPTWNNYMTNGHDVPASAYSYKQFRKILSWAKQQFASNGLAEPISFRAGGWFANLDTLKALNDEGFLIDSSGREYYIWGENHLEGYWNLISTTKPYQPSTTNQNASTPTPILTLWEFPNNGANSWFYSSDQLIKRFNDNYSQKPLSSSQTLTYLTHPHQFHVDYDVLTPTYDYIGQFLATDDNGPVVYTTLEDAYQDISK